MEFFIDGGEYEKILIKVSEFRGKEYLHFRKYYLDFTEEWLPTSKGVAMELSIENTRNIMKAMLEMLSKAESKALIEEHFLDILKDNT